MPSNTPTVASNPTGATPAAGGTAPPQMPGAGRKTQLAITKDLSNPIFTPGNAAALGTPSGPMSMPASTQELLHAIGLVKGSPLTAIPATDNSDYQLQASVQSQQVASGPTTASYDSSTNPANQPNNQPQNLTNALGTAVPFLLAKLGFTINVPKIDSAVAPPGSAGDPSVSLVRSASNQLTRWLDYSMGNGMGNETSPLSMTGLPKLANGLAGTTSRYIDSLQNLEEDAQLCLSQVAPSGQGAGEGPDCLIGGTSVLRSLMATDSGQRGASGWRYDPRSGRLIYHYMGIPFYRVNINDNVVGSPPTPNNSAPLFAANLGSTGLQLVYAYGTAQSFGFQVDETTNSQTGARQFTIHGAFALVCWEPDAIFGVMNTPILQTAP